MLIIQELFLFCLVMVADSYHTSHQPGGFNSQQDVEWHCWPLEGANSTNAFQCPHITFTWLAPVPDVVEQGVPFTMHYVLTPEEGFLQWMMDEDLLPVANGSLTAAKNLCFNQTCDGPDPDAYTDQTCCVYHNNLHSCHNKTIVEERDDMCGPWVLPSGDEFTHTQSEASPIEPWAQTLSLNTLGVNTVIAHLRLGLVQIAVAHNVNVIPKATVKPVVPTKVPAPTADYNIVTSPSNDTDCGDGYCEVQTETCKSCPADCCDNPMNNSILILVLVLVGVALVVVGVVLGILCWRRRYYSEPSITERLIAETNNLL